MLGDPTLSKSAGLSNRYTEDSLRGVVIDIYLLSLTDYLVCTFSSQVRDIYLLSLTDYLVFTFPSQVRDIYLLSLLCLHLLVTVT